MFFCGGRSRGALWKWAQQPLPQCSHAKEAGLFSISFTFRGEKWLINHVAIYHLIMVDFVLPELGPLLHNIHIWYLVTGFAWRYSKYSLPYVCVCFILTGGSNGWVLPASYLLPHLLLTTWAWCEMNYSMSTYPLVRGLHAQLYNIICCHCSSGC